MEDYGIKSSGNMMIDHKLLTSLSHSQLIAVINDLTNTIGDPAIQCIHNTLHGFESSCHADIMDDKITEPHPIPSTMIESIAEDIATSTSANDSNEPKKKKPRIARQFDISKYYQRQIALQVQYDGGKYSGFAYQDAEETIENHIFDALVKLRLIESRQTCNYSRCGRTDKGVSAFGQVISVRMRSAFPRSIHPDDVPRHPNDSYQPSCDALPILEIDYTSLINKALPNDIRIIGWCEVTSEFSARFSASYRMYRYFFVKHDLDIDRMKIASSYLIGSHDFRNFCKLDVENVTNFVREIYSVDIRPAMKPVYLSSSTASSSSSSSSSEQHGKKISHDHIINDDMIPDDDDSTAVYVMEIKGVAFLWHMVRCIMSILFLVGEHHEDPDIIIQLLNINIISSKPQYMIACDTPLVLHDCGYEHLSIQWTPRALWTLSLHYQHIMDHHLIAVARAKNAYDAIMMKHVRYDDIISFYHQMISYHKILDCDDKLKMMISHNDHDDDKMVLWSDAVSCMSSSGMKLRDDLSPYKPLLQRNTHDDYETRCSKLEGRKKERLNRHLQLRDQGSDDTGSFFTKMRQQGTKLG